MAPAGDWVSLRAAINAGCDAVYFGIKGSNMRAGAENFRISDFDRISHLCHDHGIRAYLALNTIMHESDINKIESIITKVGKTNIDAIICWDLAVITQAVSKGIPVFISTQMSVSNSESIIFFHKSFGIKRFVLARECSLSDIKKIKNHLSEKLGEGADEIEIEVFVHGAMCMSISGRCFLSQFAYGKSANRGECVQPCRREYSITDKEGKMSFLLGDHYILSPKDLCALPFLEKLIEAGVSSFKIEGRNRSPEYVSAVTAAYRKTVDFYFENKGIRGFKKDFAAIKTEVMKSLSRVYNRGLSSGFYLGKPLNEWTDRSGSKASTRKVYVGKVNKFYKKLRVAEVKIESADFQQGAVIMFQGTTTGVLTQVAESIELDHERIVKARKGSTVAVKVKRPVRRNDQVYLVKSRKGGKDFSP